MNEALKELAPDIKAIIAVASGKGGVGKSAFAANLALSLHLDGARVGILDADIYGPSQPMMLGVTESPDVVEKKFIPIQAHGLHSMSIGYLVDTDTPMIWRGPMVSTALRQLFRDTQWGPLDYLVIDLPPGTGDVQLTLAQRIPVTGAVIVTTPQDLALLDARRAVAMFQKVEVPVLGVVENMSRHVCTQCGHEETLFGEGGGLRLAQEQGIALLGSIPLDKKIQMHADSGKPTVIAEPEGTLAQYYRAIARLVADNMKAQSKKVSLRRFPKIVLKK